MQSIIILGPIILLTIAGLIFLQIFLSKKENRWLGLILPIIAFICSIIAPYNILSQAFELEPIAITMAFLLMTLLAWVLANIPTMILLVIYLICRRKFRRKKQFDKMNIQDLD